MQAIIDTVKDLFNSWSPVPLKGMEKIPQSGSNRIYFRILTDSGSYIATYNENVRENRTFIYFSRHFRAKGCPVPEIYTVNEAATIYLQQDFGDVSLLGELERQGHNDRLYSLFQQS